MGMLEDSHPGYEMYQMFSEPACHGFAGTARRRTWVIAAREGSTSCLVDPFELNTLISQWFTDNVQCQVQDYLVASTTEILMEASMLARRRGITAYIPGQTPLRHLLLPRENQVRSELDGKYLSKFGTLPEDNPNLAYFLGDSSSYCSWSACSGMLPTFRLNSRTGLFWLPAQHRWLTAKERLVALGFPCIPEIADTMKVPLIGAADTQRAADICGNSMHFTTAAIMQLVALASFGPMC